MIDVKIIWKVLTKHLKEFDMSLNQFIKKWDRDKTFHNMAWTLYDLINNNKQLKHQVEEMKKELSNG